MYQKLPGSQKLELKKCWEVTWDSNYKRKSHKQNRKIKGQPHKANHACVLNGKMQRSSVSIPSIIDRKIRKVGKRGIVSAFLIFFKCLLRSLLCLENTPSSNIAFARSLLFATCTIVAITKGRPWMSWITRRGISSWTLSAKGTELLFTDSLT